MAETDGRADKARADKPKADTARTDTAHKVAAGPVELDEVRNGSGSPLVYLHGEDGLLFSGPVRDALGASFTVRAPEHPGWGRSDRPWYVNTVDDLSYVYLDYLDATLDEPAPLIGTSFGAWLAAEVAVKSTAKISSLVLVAPVGIKVADRETRDFVDVYASTTEQVAAATYGDGARPDLRALAADEFFYLAEAQEAMARYGFRPYLHDPALVHRLHRIDVPTLVLWGADDRFVREPDTYAAAWATAIGSNAEVASLPGGHRLEEQSPAAVADAVTAFVAGTAGSGVAGGGTAGSGAAGGAADMSVTAAAR